MSIQVIIGALAVAAAVPVLVYSLATPGHRWLFGRNQNVLADVADVRELVLTRSPWERLVLPLTRSIGGIILRLSPKGWADKTARSLALAGMHGRVKVEQILVAKAALSVGLFLVGVFGLVPRLDLGWLLTILIAVIGFFLPDIWVSRKAKERQHQIEIELPDVIDQLTMSVEAGLGFEAALARTSRVGEGPLAEELNRTVQEMQLGVSRSDALRNLADRTDVADLKSFVLTVVQSEEYGLPIAKVLSVQADELRDKRRQRAEERALKIPVFLIFPLAFCIFPTIFIIVLGPALIRIYRGMALLG
jgi:tight adherence protein C